MRHSRSAVAATIAVGLLGGTAAAVLAHVGSPSTASPPGAAALPPIRVAPARRPPGRLPDGRYSSSQAHHRIDRASVRVDARTPDPAGGPEWAVRTWSGERMALRRPSRTLDQPTFHQAQHCVELGRVMASRFGWAFADRRFRPAGPGDVLPLAACGPGKRPKPQARATAVLAFPSPAEPLVERTVVWGYAPPGTRSVSVRGLGAADGPVAVTRGGGFLVLADPGISIVRTEAAVTFRTHDGRTTVQPLVAAFAPPPLPGWKVPRLRPETQLVEARAPDPAGGPGWGVPTVQQADGRWCTGQAAQVVGDRTGFVDSDYGLFDERRVAPTACRNQAAPTRDRPLTISWGGGNGLEEHRGSLRRRAAVERRLLPGRFELTAVCLPDVERVVIQTPSDRRTLIPSARAHVVYATWNGDFPAGRMVVTAELKGGRTYTQRLAMWF